MEKKMRRTLKLNKKTLRDLTPKQISKAAGGGRGTANSGASNCCCEPPTP